MKMEQCLRHVLREGGCSLLFSPSHFLPDFVFYPTLHLHGFGFYVNTDGPQMLSLDLYGFKIRLPLTKMDTKLPCLFLGTFHCPIFPVSSPQCMVHYNVQAFQSPALSVRYITMSNLSNLWSLVYGILQCPTFPIFRPQCTSGLW